jgi:hypothetical protein
MPMMSNNIQPSCEIAIMDSSGEEQEIRKGIKVTTESIAPSIGDEQLLSVYGSVEVL